MFSKVWAVARDPENRAAISWLGGGAAAAASGIWIVVTFMASHADAPAKVRGGTTVTQSGTGIASGATQQ